MSPPDDSLDSNMPRTGTVLNGSANIKSTPNFADPIANFATSFASSRGVGQGINTGKPPSHVTKLNRNTARFSRPSTDPPLHPKMNHLPEQDRSGASTKVE
ncbi:hypothetical protein N0V85_007820, partial [Neurospora sp. IMI 360204]